ncbi:MAG: 50S ribosomal protein L3 [Candidatus Aenigmarchaeota archaeon]|nr:50S ribosomal protein L3 [Candidatus Aenigmarchaeota archaeon]MCX8191088.1 50S ribosomal protein L3 [Candidatus Aenigmarchaeota archaeon]MDW8160198.1 50S ribosomal protein L3 [Candidatus Aenigmarchaeota archaeon]
MPHIRKPREGSLAFYPRKKAFRIYPSLDTYPESEKVMPLVFAGYKVGMCHVMAVDNKKTSPSFGQTIAVPVTVLEIPPLHVIGVRFYKKTKNGYKVFTEIYAKELPKHLERKVKIKSNYSEEKIEEISKNLDKIEKVRLIVATQPKKTGIGKKTPEVFEIEVGGKDVKAKFEYAISKLGKELSVEEVFKEGEIVDVIAVTKGKGTQGPVKRFGIKIQGRKAKEKRRHVGSLGQERPGKVRWTVPMAGQTGFQTRTEINKRIIKIGNGEEINPKGGFKRYGLVRGSYLLIEGSVPGSKKRLILIRKAIRSKGPHILPYQIKSLVR